MRGLDLVGERYPSIFGLPLASGVQVGRDELRVVRQHLWSLEFLRSSSRLRDPSLYAARCLFEPLIVRTFLSSSATLSQSRVF